MYCTDRLSEILSDDIYAETQICNLYGTKGVGKSHMVAELMKERRKSGCPCGYLDFEEYKGLAAHTTLNTLYQICDYLTAKHGMALTQFEIADEVNRERWGRIPYCQRKKRWSPLPSTRPPPCPSWWWTITMRPVLIAAGWTPSSPTPDTSPGSLSPARPCRKHQPPLSVH